MDISDPMNRAQPDHVISGSCTTTLYHWTHETIQNTPYSPWLPHPTASKLGRAIELVQYLQGTQESIIFISSHVQICYI